jgi:hypothetical protein
VKEIVRHVIQRTARVPVLGRLYDVFQTVRRASGWIYDVSRHHQRPADLRRLEARLAALSLSDLAVKHGPFAGMRYPSARAHGSMLLPKLIGSYERELHATLAALGDAYTSVVDIGCAEGYYAVGLALRMPGARVFAFDTAAEARDWCRALAAANGVADRVHVAGSCDQATLAALDLGARSLFVCDCEGYEKVLIDARMGGRLGDHDLIVETHDFLDIGISTAIKRALAATHHLSSVYSTDDIQKALGYDYPELAGFSLQDRCSILAEGRPAIMEWVIARSRTRG